MARPGPQSLAKRQREMKKREKRLAKQEKMAQRKAARARGEEPLPPPEDEFGNPLDPNR